MVTPVPPPPSKEPSKALRVGLIAAAILLLVLAWMITSVMLATPGANPSLRAEFMALPESVQPDPTVPNRYPDLVAKLAAFDAIIEQVKAEAQPVLDERSVTDFIYTSVIDFRALAPASEADESDATTPEGLELQKRYTQEALDRMDRAGLFDDIAEILRSPNLANPYEAGIDEKGESRALYLWEMPELGRMRYFSLAQIARARMARENGKPHEAAELLAQIAPLPVVLTRQATVIEHLVGYAIAELVLTEARAIATDPAADTSTLTTLERAIEPLNRLNTPQIAFEGERLGSRDAHDRTHTSGGRLIPSAQDRFMSEIGFEEDTSSEPGTLARLADIRGYAYASRGASLDLMNTYYTKITNAIDETNPATRETLITDADRMAEEVSWRYPLPRVLLPALGKFVEQWYTIQHSVAVTQIILAMAEYRLGNGDWPESLDQIVPDYLNTVPIDPQTGDPFEYEHTPGQPPTLESFGPKNEIED
ncbi:MAG: hypothetical protein ACF8MJ_09215 [Phycisphaerales bacterium JB050]